MNHFLRSFATVVKAAPLAFYETTISFLKGIGCLVFAFGPLVLVAIFSEGLRAEWFWLPIVAVTGAIVWMLIAWATVIDWLEL
jgi:hypothetical protein